MYTNKLNFPLPVAVMLAADSDYDAPQGKNIISATTLQRPLRSLVLSARCIDKGLVDIDSLVASKLGTAVHSAMEDAWVNNWQQALRNLNTPQSVIDRIRVNPVEEEEGCIHVYLERRTQKEIMGYVISGKFDAVIDGELHDLKTTKTYSFISGSNERDYQLQGSIYRWLNPDIIKSDYLTINYIFTDWSPIQAQANKDYPVARCIAKRIPLLSLTETENYIRDRISQLIRYENADQSELPLCTSTELWQEAPTFAYYKDPSKTQRATKLFDVEQDAFLFKQTQGGQGMIVKRPSEPKRCLFCPASSMCTQAEQFVLQGILKL